MRGAMIVPPPQSPHYRRSQNRYAGQIPSVLDLFVKSRAAWCRYRDTEFRTTNIKDVSAVADGQERGVKISAEMFCY